MCLIRVLLSIGGALLGAAIWAGVAIVTGYEIGWIAIGLGALAGLGMNLGSRKTRWKAGVSAAIIAIIGIVAAKAVIFSHFELKGQSEAAEVASYLATEKYRMIRSTAETRAHKQNTRSVAELSQLIEAEKSRVEALSEADLEAELVEYRMWRDDGRFKDEQWVRNFLIYQRAQGILVSQVEEEYQRDGSPSEEERWQILCAESTEVIDAMTVEEREIKAREEAERSDRVRSAIIAFFQEYENPFTSVEGIAYFAKSAFSQMDVLFAAFAAFAAFEVANMDRATRRQ